MQFQDMQIQNEYCLINYVWHGIFAKYQFIAVAAVFNFW